MVFFIGAKPQMDRKHPLVLSPEWVSSLGTRDDHSPRGQYFLFPPKMLSLVIVLEKKQRI